MLLCEEGKSLLSVYAVRCRRVDCTPADASSSAVAAPATPSIFCRTASESKTSAGILHTPAEDYELKLYVEGVESARCRLGTWRHP